MTRFWVEFNQHDAGGIESGKTRLSDHFEFNLFYMQVSGKKDSKSMSIKIHHVEPVKPCIGQVIYSVNEQNVLTYFIDNYDTSD